MHTLSLKIVSALAAALLGTGENAPDNRHDMRAQKGWLCI